MNTNALRAEIIRNGLRQEDVAKSIGVSASTFCRRMKNGDFGLDEVNKMITLLNIQQPGPIFFTRKLT